MDRAVEAAKDSAMEEIFVFGEAAGATHFAALMAEPAESLNVDIDPAKDLVALPYSSGTTGLAKGVMLTHRNLVANVLQYEQAQHLREDDQVLGVMPGAGEDGEILIRGPQVITGYLNNQAATEQMLDKDGWLHTGDIGHADQDGDFYVVDRLKELINYKGYQVPPAELEAILLTHPGVADAAVIPHPDEDAGEIPKAFVVLKSPATAEELIQFVAERVAPHKKIRLVETIDEIPKSASGKILRRKLVERERSATAPR